MQSRNSDGLEKLKRLIRVGLPLSEMPPGHGSAAGLLEAQIKKTIKALDDQGIAKAPLADALQYKTLKAEFEYAFGKPGSAAQDLESFLAAKRLPGRLEDWFASARSPQSARSFRFREDADDRDALRQKIWALMGLSFYGKYLNGDVRTAFKWLNMLRQLIESELLEMDTAHPPHGTRARVHYFLAHCYRTMRNFPRSETHFLEAQKHADRRLRREIDLADRLPDNERRRKRQYEYQFGVICTARVLTGLGRLAMLQGHLRRAGQFLHSARTLIVPSGMEMLKLVVDSHIAITERRLCEPGAKGWQLTLRELETCYRKFEEQDDRHGTRRCGQELARAYLDQAESLPLDKRSAPLAAADRWIDELGKLGHKWGSRGQPELFRMHVFRACRILLGATPDLALAEQDLEKANSMDEPQRHSQDLGVERVEVQLAQGMLRLAKQSLSPPADGDDGNRASMHFSQLRDFARRSNDRVLESEALLRLAIAEASENREAQAQQHLDVWRRYHAPFVENASLHCLHLTALKSIVRPQLDFPSLDLDENLRRVKQYLWALAKARSKNDTEAARLLRISRDRMLELKRAVAPPPEDDRA
ncbi:MAG: hypothetical protein KIT09_24615 [Bryobacteraceae bacterium]|nr:hypothetical protein [Bryobacteraceae bacterium]